VERGGERRRYHDLRCSAGVGKEDAHHIVVDPPKSHKMLNFIHTNK
jgi:hypothetical protein